MCLYLINLRTILRNDRLIALSAVTFICIFILMSCARVSSDPNNPTGGVGSEPAADVNNANGPTVTLSYGCQTYKKNSISYFMYFIPLISPTVVDRETSANNEQQVGIVSYERNVTSDTFYVTCEFEISGKGFHKNTFDPAGMMALFIDELEEGELLTNMLDYIQFEGEGFGRIEVKGTIAGSIQTVTEMNMQFNAKGHKSPVTIGLYDVEPRDGQYKYENRSNEVVARVNSLVFRKSEKDPRMGIKVASISKSPDSEGFWASIKGAIANLLIRPPKVDKLGNDTMLDFGYAMLKKEPEFTFPIAKNIRETRVAAMDPTKK